MAGAMKSNLLLLSVFLVAAACGPAEDSSAEFSVVEQPLATDPWQNLFSVRGSGSNFIVNPVGTMSITCPDGAFRSECAVSRLNLARNSALNSERQQQVLNRVAVEPADEARISVIMKGLFVSVRDTRYEPPLTYVEFRVSAVYVAPSIVTHATSTLYAVSDVVDGLQAARSINSDLLPRGISIPYAARFRWVGAGTAPTSYPADSLASVSAYRAITGGTGGLGWGPYEFDVNQQFKRLVN